MTFENSAFESQTKENVRTAENAGHDMEKVEKQAATAAKKETAHIGSVINVISILVMKKQKMKLKRKTQCLRNLPLLLSRETERQ